MIIDGKAIAEEIKEEIAARVSKLPTKPGLGVILVGDNPASQIYVKMKRKACKKVGMQTYLRELPESVSSSELCRTIDEWNRDPEIHGILLQLPLPKHMNAMEMMMKIAPEKDIDGFHPINVGKVFSGDETGFCPCTPKGIQELLLRSNVIIAGKHVVIVGRSQIVGKPLASLLLQKNRGGNATVTVAHSHTEDVVGLCRQADILVACLGAPHFIKKGMVKPGAVVIDVGITRVEDESEKGYHIVGDVDFLEVKDDVSMITPVPGGVGPMTIAMLLRNTLSSYQSMQKVLL